MKKFTIFILMCAMVVGLFQAVFAQLDEKKAELTRVRNYIKLLDKKIEKARAKKQINKISNLKDLKRKELKRARALKAEIAGLGKGKSEELAQSRTGVEEKGGLLAEIGFTAGTGVIQIGYLLPLLEGLDIAFDAGYGMGNQYSIVTAGVSGIIPFGNYFTGLGIGLANSSDSLGNIAGVSGNIAKGSNAGLEVFGGTAIGPLNAQIGYNTALGLLAGAVYKF